MHDYIVTPDGRLLYDGTIVMIPRIPELKWVLHKGIYVYDNAKHNGWYFVSIPTNSTMPMYESDLVNIVIISQPHPCPPGPPGPFPPGPIPPGPFPPGPTPPGPCPPGPCPPGPHPPMDYPYTKYERDSVYRSMLTVDTVRERDMLNCRDVQDGRVVRVNDYEGRVEYFQWSRIYQEWQLLSLGDRYPDREQLEQIFATIESVEDIDGRLVDVETALATMDWEDIDKLVEDMENNGQI